MTRVLFVGVHIAGRGRMAAALWEALLADLRGEP
jgi:hypothetical protein